MKAMILAAGRGERMRPLTDLTPKPLLMVGAHQLIVWHILRLAAAGVCQIVINHSWLGEKIECLLGDGAEYGVNISYSAEEHLLETAGGIANALPLLGDEPFIVLNGDVFTDVDFAALGSHYQRLSADGCLAHLLLVSNPDHHQQGDFVLCADGRLAAEAANLPKLTFTGVGLYHPALFTKIASGAKAKLAPLLLDAMRQKRISAERHAGLWLDVGTPERLLLADKIAKKMADLS